MLRPQLFLNICGRFSSSERVCEYFLAIENGTCYTQYVNHLTRRVDRMEALRDKKLPESDGKTFASLFTTLKITGCLWYSANQIERVCRNHASSSATIRRDFLI